MRRTPISLILLLSCIISANANNNDCGRIKIKSSNQLSFNGTSAIPGLFPWLAPLFHSQKGYVCGSSIITKNHLLTAAHCVISKAKDYHALFGRFDLSNDDEVNWTNRNMSKVYVHDEFNIGAKNLRSNADIAIFTFLLEIQFNDYVQPICLPDQSSSTINIPGIVAGYGKTDIYGNYQNTPSYVLLNSTDSWSCISKDIRYSNIVCERSFCAGSQTSIPCQGDSGGGYYSRNQVSRKYTIYGIVSFAIGLCDPKDYVAFVDVPKFIPWINEKINENIGETSDPCELTDCGMHSECRVINERASCRCMHGFLGTPPYCDIACSTDSECSTSRSCYRGICTNLCLGSRICHENAECSMQDHRPDCKCKDGFIGDGFRKCEVDETQKKTATAVKLLMLSSENQKGITYNENEARKLFLDPKLKDRKVVVISIVGLFKKGKSFLLNYMLRYLYAHYPTLLSSELVNADNWMGDPDEPLTGFKIKSGRDVKTNGLYMWNDVFLYDAPNGDKFAIYIMDTQVLFDHRLLTTDNFEIVSLGTLISSLQILNIFNEIDETQLQNFEFATMNKTKSFQNLLILIRDWNDVDEYEYGLSGGDAYLESFLEIHDYQSQQLKSMRRYITSSFEKINCFLMPYPSKIVATDKNYNGRWADIDEDFIEEMKKLFAHIFENLNPKTINGVAIKTDEMFTFIKSYVENLNRRHE